MTKRRRKPTTSTTVSRQFVQHDGGMMDRRNECLRCRDWKTVMFAAANTLLEESAVVGKKTLHAALSPVNERTNDYENLTTVVRNAECSASQPASQPAHLASKLASSPFLKTHFLWIFVVVNYFSILLPLPSFLPSTPAACMYLLVHASLLFLRY